MFTLLAQAPAAGPVNMIDIQGQIATISPVATVGMLVQLAAGAILVVGALAVLYFLLRGGLGWILAGGEKAKVEEARSMITQAIIGMVILASVFALFGVLLDFFGLRDRINIGNYGGSSTTTGGTGGTTGGGGTGGTAVNPQTQCPDGSGIGAVANAGSGAGYCVSPTDGSAAPARVRCVGPGQGPSAYNYAHFEPCACGVIPGQSISGIAKPGIRFDAPACP